MSLIDPDLQIGLGESIQQPFCRPFTPRKIIPWYDFVGHEEIKEGSTKGNFLEERQKTLDKRVFFFFMILVGAANDLVRGVETGQARSRPKTTTDNRKIL